MPLVPSMYSVPVDRAKSTDRMTSSSKSILTHPSSSINNTRDASISAYSLYCAASATRPEPITAPSRKNSVGFMLYVSHIGIRRTWRLLEFGNISLLLALECFVTWVHPHASMAVLKLSSGAFLIAASCLAHG